MLQLSGADDAAPSTDRHPSATDDYRHIRRAIEFLTEEAGQQPDLDRLAGHLGLSPTYCQRLFKRWCGLSPKAFVQAVTFDRARGLLERDGSVLGAALEAGLSGPGRLHDLFVDHASMTPGDHKRRGAGLVIRYGFHPSPFGLALLMTTDRGLCGLAFADDEDGQEAALADMTRRWPAAQFRAAPEATGVLARQLFDPSCWRPDRPVRLIMIGSDFEVRVWEALLTIPLGQQASYSDIATRLGQPNAARAVGAAVGRNPLSFVVPCHRVLGKGGSLTGYHWGITRKRAIIGWEKGQLQADG
ncbi:MAG: bifunctional helix-turn-helix domain-containing protein/methylated-DNA--[protein]-cysteine S-methyltransferase [Hyphomicrobiaceae bacterium]